MDSLKCQTQADTPAKTGDLPIGLAGQRVSGGMGWLAAVVERSSRFWRG